MVMAVGVVRSWNARQVRAWGQKFEIKPLGLDFGCAVGNSS